MSVLRASGVTLLSEKQLLEGQQLYVVQGDISKMKCDAVVHPTSSSMHPSGQCGQALKKVGGDSFQAGITALVNSRGTLGLSEAAMSPGGSLPATNVIHVHSPSYGHASSMDELRDAVINCVETAGDNNVVTLAFPSIGSGGNGFPKDEAARHILKTLRNYYRTNVSSVQEIYFVLYDSESVGIYSTELGRLSLGEYDD